MNGEQLHAGVPFISQPTELLGDPSPRIAANRPITVLT